MANSARIGVESPCPKLLQFKVGDKIKAKIAGLIVDATVRAVIEHTDGSRLQVDFGNEQTALIQTWQVVND